MMLAKMLVSACLGSMFSTAALSQPGGDPRRGITFAQATCAVCHGVLATDLTSPRLDSVTFKVIANAPGMTGIAINVWLLTPHRSMPDLIIEPQDRADVIAYIVSLKDTP
jgi:cytochrome c2